MTIAPAPILPRRLRARDRLASALVVADAAEPDASPLADALAAGLAERGLAASALRVRRPDVGDWWVSEALEAGQASIAALRAAPQVDGHRVGIVGIGLGAALASLLSVHAELRRIAMVSPVSIELVVRRLDRLSGAELPPDEPGLRALARLEPLRALVESGPRPTLILLGAAEDRSAHEHALSIASALQLDGRRVARHAVAFADRRYAAAPLLEALLVRLRDFLAVE